MKKEYWKIIKGYENYMISSLGRIKIINYRNTGKERIMKPQLKKNGYLDIGLNKNGIQKRFLIHRLVAEAFIPNPDNLPQVNHKDENKLNNAVENLEWCDAKYNVNYGTALTRRTIKKSKIVYQYDLKGNFIREWSSTMECGRNGYNQGSVSACCRGKRKYHKDCIWKYKEDY